MLELWISLRENGDKTTEIHVHVSKASIKSPLSKEENTSATDQLLYLHWLIEEGTG